MRLLAGLALALLYVLASLSHFSFTHTSLYQSKLPPLDPQLELCNPDAPPLNTSDCSHCSLLPLTTHFHCLACTPTPPTLCDPRNEADRNASRRLAIRNRSRFTNTFLVDYARTRGWFLRVLLAAGLTTMVPEDRGPLAWCVDDLLRWTLNVEPLSVDPVCIVAALLCCTVATTALLAGLWLEWRHRAATDSDYREKSNAFVQAASDSVIGPAEQLAAAAALAAVQAERDGSDMWGLGLSNRKMQ